MMREIAAAVDGARLKGVIVEKPLARNVNEMTRWSDC
jgi:hypothetical protein